MSLRRIRLVSALLVSAAAASPHLAQACDSTGCFFVTRSASGVLAKGAWRLDLSFRDTEDTLLMSGSEVVGQVRRPKVDFENGTLRPGFHQELGGRARFVQFDLAYGLSRRLTVLASAPVFTNRSFDIGHPPILSENYETWGFGDTLLGFRHVLFSRADLSLVGGLAIELPTGSHRLVAPEALFDIGILDPMLQPGSGSFDFVANLQYSHRLTWGDLHLVGAVSYQANTVNDLEYRYGSDAVASLSLARAVVGGLRGSVQLKWTKGGRSEFHGEPVPSTGGTIVYVTPGLTVNPFRRLSVYAFLPVPVYRYVNEFQLAPRTGLVVGVSRSF